MKTMKKVIFTLNSANRKTMVMKKYIKSAIILVAVLAFTGCNKTEEFQYNYESALQIESVSNISPFTLMQELASKAVITGETLPTDEANKGIGLFVTAADGSAYDGKVDGYSNVKYTYNGEKWSAAFPIYLSNTAGKLYGYFPYSETATDLKAIPVESSLNGTDYLYATSQDVSLSNKSVNLQMNHALERLHLTIKRGDKYLSDCNLSKIVLKSKSIDATGTMDITTGTVTATKQSDATGTVELTGTDAVTASGIEKDILLVPADNSAGPKDLTLTLTIDGVDAVVNFKEDEGLDIRQGIQCNATLTIEDTGIKVTGVGVGVWGDGGSQTVQVNGHTVTVKLDEDQFPEVANDVLLGYVKVETGNVIVEAYSKSQKRLECYLDGLASCKTRTNTIFRYKPVAADEINLISYIFTISDISTDVTATIGYPRPDSMSLSPSNHTTYAECSFKLRATVLPDDTYNKRCTWSSSDPSVATVDENGKVTAKSEGEVDITATTVVGGITATCTVTVKPFGDLIISGKFSVGSSKFVHFSRGNLYYDGSRYCIEDHQYDTTPSSVGMRSNNHISHFMWCDNAENAGALRYNTVWNGTNKSFFAAKDFTANDFSEWFTLSYTQWQYLLAERKTTYGTGILSEHNHRYAAVKVKDMAGLLLFPDEFSWPTEAGDEPITFNTASSTWNDRNYNVSEFNVLQDNGCVFLPAAGIRKGDPNSAASPETVLNVGIGGYYWSSTPIDASSAYYLDFFSDTVNPANDSERYFAFAVRLVTDVK